MLKKSLTIFALALITAGVVACKPAATTDNAAADNGTATTVTTSTTPAAPAEGAGDTKK